MVRKGHAPEPELVSNWNSFLNQLPRTIPVTKPGENEPQEPDPAVSGLPAYEHVQDTVERSGLGNECQRCGKPGEVFYYQGVEVTLCGDCLEYLDEIVTKVKQQRDDD